jgi:hypothetical protein
VIRKIILVIQYPLWSLDHYRYAGQNPQRAMHVTVEPRASNCKRETRRINRLITPQIPSKKHSSFWPVEIFRKSLFPTKRGERKKRVVSKAKVFESPLGFDVLVHQTECAYKK